jgi:hypothetical protein
MLELSCYQTIASPDVVICHEIEMALERCFPGRVVPGPFEFLGVGLEHAAAGRDFEIPLPWSPELELSFLSGMWQWGEPRDFGPATSLTIERQYKASLEQWRGASSKYPPDELEREIYDTKLGDINSLLQVMLAHHQISSDEFVQLGELRWRAFLDAMPSQKADMHLKRQWAKNASLRPRDSDLIDWAFLAVAVSYCDIVVTENQMANLFSRGFDMHATVIARLGQLPELVA